MQSFLKTDKSLRGDTPRFIHVVDTVFLIRNKSNEKSSAARILQY